jgi:GNAT superfamily N-acetyltransferase
MWVARSADKDEQVLPSLDMDGKETENPDIIGCVQLAFHTSPNGIHRSEVRKLIVDERYQGKGIARVLMMELEREAKTEGSTLCVSRTNQPLRCN